MPTDPIDTLQSAALRWFGQHLAEHLHTDRDRAVKRCAAWLLGEGHADAGHAREVALRALGAVEARANHAYIDLDRSTSHTLFLIDPASAREFAFTAADLAHLAHGAVERCPISTPRYPQPATAAAQ